MFDNEHLLNMKILLSLLFLSSVVCLNVSKGELLDISKLLKDFQVRKISMRIRISTICVNPGWVRQESKTELWRFSCFREGMTFKRD